MVRHALDPVRLDEAFALARRQVETGERPFIVLGVANAAGTIRLDSVSRPDAPRVGTNAVCLLASITKPIVATTILRLVETGRLDLEVPLGDLAPASVNARWAPITAWHVLSHTTGIDDIDLEQVLRHGGTRADLLRHVARQPQVAPPGTRYHYASFTFDLLGEAVAEAVGVPFERILRDEVLAPLAMTSTTFDPRPDAELAARATDVAIGRWDGPPTREDQQLQDAYTSLHLLGGGLWSSAPDLLRFGRAMLRGGELDGARVLSPAFVDLMTREVTVPRDSRSAGLGAQPDPLLSDHYALGWGKPGVATPASSVAFGHGGVSGTRLWIDPEADLVYVYLSGSWGMPRTPIDAVEHAIYAALA